MRFGCLFRKTMLENLRDWKIISMTLAFAPFFVVLMHFYFGEITPSYTIAVVNRDEGVRTSEGAVFRGGEELIAALEAVESEEGASVFTVHRTEDLDAARAALRDREVSLVVEIPAGSRNKYEFDEEARVIRLDRVLSSAVFYNFDYGFIEGTRADDGDHTDAMLLIDEPTFPGCHVWARPVGVLKMADEQGVDYKVLCVALADPMYAHLEALRQVSPHKLREIEQFFHTYKNLEDKSVEIDGWAGVAETLEILRLDHARWVAEQTAGEGATEA